MLREGDFIGFHFLALIGGKENLLLILPKHNTFHDSTSISPEFRTLLRSAKEEKENFPIPLASGTSGSEQDKYRVKKKIFLMQRKGEIGRVHRPGKENIYHFISHSQVKDF